MVVINWIPYCHQLFDLYLDDVSIKKEHGNLSLIYIAKHSLSPSYQEHIWVLLTTCSNPKLSPASLLPSHYLP